MGKEGDSYRRLKISKSGENNRGKENGEKKKKRGKIMKYMDVTREVLLKNKV